MTRRPSPAAARRASAVPGYPFAALVGQERLRTALLLCAVDRRIGGVLLRGEKGTAKSTAVRALADLLPEGERMRTLPLSTTEDRLVGGVDLERTLDRGAPVLSPGLLVQVHGGLLYVDEVNLLDDHLAGILLAVAGSGSVRIEREGFSRTFPSEFRIVGTMNPEEGDLRPHLLDRFGLCVDVRGERDPRLRATLLQRRTAYDADPEGFARQWHERTTDLADRVALARELLPLVCPSPRVRPYVAQLCRDRGVAGHRADLVLERAATAHAAWAGRTRVEVDDVLAVAELVLVHRGRHAAPPQPPRRSPRDRAPDGGQDPDRHGTGEPGGGPPGTEGAGGEGADAAGGGGEGPGTDGGTGDRDGIGAGPGSGPGAGGVAEGGGPSPEGEARDRPDPAGERVFATGEPFAVRPLPVREDRGARGRAGRRLRTRSVDRTGRCVGARPSDDARDLALDATLRAAAPHQARRRPPGSAGLVVHRSDWHARIRRRRSGTLVLFVVDASGSMGVRGRMLASKGAVLSLLLDVYRKRDRVGMVTFRGRGARLALPPTCSVDLAGRLLRDLPTGGRTPLAHGLVLAHRTLEVALRRDPGLRPVAVVVTDGRATWGLDGPVDPGEVPRLACSIAAEQRVRWVVVDTEDPRGVRLGRAGDLADHLGARVLGIEDLRADDLIALAKGHQS